MKPVFIMRVGMKQYVVPMEAFYITINEMQGQLKSVQAMNLGFLTDKLIDYIVNDNRYRELETKPADVLELVRPIKVLVRRDGCGFLFTYDLDPVNGLGVLYTGGSFQEIGPQEVAQRRSVVKTE